MMDILEEAKDVLHQEAQGIEKLIPTLNQNFVNAVNMIMKSKGRVIVTGMGKSGHIARKVSATLSSTGTPSISSIRPKPSTATWAWSRPMMSYWPFRTAGKP